MKNKKILGLLLAGVMVTSIPFNVFADDNSESLDLSEAKVPVAVTQGEPVENTPSAGEGTEVTYTLTFKFYDGREDKVITVKENETTAPPNLQNTREGYHFDGWVDEDGNVFNLYTKVTKNLVLHDQWAKLWTVTFDRDGGYGPTTQEVRDKHQLFRPNKPTKEGFKFVGWYEDAEKTTEYDFDKLVTQDITLYAKWEEEKAPVPVTQDLAISNIEYNGRYVSGKVTADGEPVYKATVTLKIDGSKTAKSKLTDEFGNFTIDLGDYYNYYWNDNYYKDGYYYRDGYYDGYKVYRDSDGDYYYIKNGERKYIGYSDYYWRYRDYKADLIAEKTGYNSVEANLWSYGNRYYGRDWYYGKYDHRVYPTDISRTNYSASGYLRGYKNRTVYVYDDGTYLGSAKIDSDGYFSLSWNSPYVASARSLEYYVDGTYVSDSSYSMIPVVNTVSAGASFVRGNAGPYAEVTVYDANGVRLGGATAGSTGIFNISLNRALRAGETIKVEAKEAGKTSRSTEVKIAGYEAKATASVNQPAYIAGFPDGTFKPGNEVTRAEAVRMFVKLVNDGKELPKNPTTKFKDANNAWYSDEINFAVSKGFISGYSDGTFKPNQGITRAEFAQMIAVFVKDGYPGSSNFKDVKGHWASNAINQLYGNKTIKGFPDGTFKPDQKLTRAEAVTVLNSVFGRNTKATSLTNVNVNSLRKFSDVPMSHWAYYEIIDASNGHNAVKGDRAEDVSLWQ